MTSQKTQFATMLVLAVASALHADEADSNHRTVSVTGTAVMRTVPDVISWNITTNDYDQDLLRAKASSDAKMKKILGLKDALGVKIADMQTGRLNVQKVYNRDRSGNQTDFKHFAVSRSVTMKQRDPKKFDEFLTTLISAAEMDVSFNFETSRMHELRADTRLKALQIAKEKAKAMTKVLGAKLGQVTSIAEHQPANYFSSPASNSAYFDRGAALPDDVADGTFAPGAIDIRISIHVTFEIE